MLSLTDILLIARHEIATTLRGRRGVVLVVTLLLLALVPALLRLAGQHSDQAAALQRAHTAALVKIYDRDIARALLDCPAVLVVAAITVFFFQPLFMLLAGSDRLAGDIDSSRIRYWTIRAPRPGVLLGKALGLWALVSLITVGALAAITIVAIVDAPRDWLWTLGWGARIMLFSSASALVYASLCAFLGAAVARPRLVFMLGLGVLFVLRLSRLALEQHGVTALASWFPGALDRLFLTAGSAAKLTAVAVVAIWSGALLSAAAAVFKRRPV